MLDEKPDSGKALVDALVGCQIHLDAVAERVAQEAAVEEKPDGGPAFPEYENPNGLPMGTPRVKPIGGMSLRDWFAGLAMQSLLRLGSAPSKTREDDCEDEPDQPWYFGNWESQEDECVGVDALGCDAYWVADAILKARGQ